MEFLNEKVICIALFILIIHTIETLAYSVRLSGARVGLIASALSLFNIMVIVSRMSNMLQQPFTGSLVDEAQAAGTTGFVESQFRIIIGASTIGSIVGIILLPTFVALFSRMIIHLSNQGGSMPSLFKTVFTVDYFKRGLNLMHLPRRSYLDGVSLKDMPKRLFFINMMVTAIYTIGVLSALYAGLLAPERSNTAVLASGMINGVATILLSVFVDPKISVMADNVIRKKGSYSTLKNVSIMMVTSRLLGTMVAQLLFIPGAKYIAWLTQFIT
ncbi:lipid II flippase Amj family protein [Halobacillus sp. BBL2006]|uniref:lipid II flippase Amj family protein n=1 Tax=Halobacillus sp. BBL2006 TaxID=1543706 RepID=UPI0005426C8F|nr:lipid II flippase Amj family protein [Halobacillus sp. BBL2006]KHE72128.1 membrane protein [Halobacillus sp. BBL2006]